MYIKKKRNKFEKKLIAGSLAVFIAIVSINPTGIILAYNESISTIIDAEFSEELAEDSMSANITLQINEKENQEIVAITMPDGNKIEKQNFTLDESENINVKYMVSENVELSYLISYRESEMEVVEDINKEVVKKDMDVLPETTPVIKEEKIKYTVSNIKTISDMKLDFVATDFSSPVGVDVDVMKDIIVQDEDGKNITSKVNIEVIDYDGFSKDKVGSYILTYRTMHPVSDEEYTFVRTINIVDTQIKENTDRKFSNARLSNDTSIVLSSGNASLKVPSNFKIGKNDQETFNITVNYTSSAITKNRELNVYIPKGFSLVKEITNEQISSAESIKTSHPETGETLIHIVLKKNIEIVSAFDLFIKQEKKYLYDQANVAKQTYSFRIESYEDSSKIDETQLVITTDKLKSTITDKLITIDPVDKYAIEYSDSNAAGKATIGNKNANTFIIKKEAYSDLSVHTLRLPDRLENKIPINWSYETRYEILIGDKVVKTGGSLPMELDGFNNKRLNLLDVVPEFMYSYEDAELRIHSVNLTWYGNDVENFLYDNPDQPFQSLSEIKIDGHQSFGKVSIAAINTNNPKIAQSPETNTFEYKGSPWYILQGSGIPLAYTFSYKDENLHHKNTIFEYEFPFEIKPYSFVLNQGVDSNMYYRGLISIVLETNRGRKIIVNQKNVPVVNYKVNFESLLNHNEYIVKIEVDTPMTGKAGFGFLYNTSLVNKDGVELSDKETVTAKSKVRVKGNTIFEKDYPVYLYKANKDNLRLGTDYFPNLTTTIGVGDYLGTGYYIIPYDAKNYEKFDIIVEGKEMISLTRGLRLKKEGAKTITFDTNKRNNVEINVYDGDDRDINFPLDEDEYLTTLKLTFKGIYNKATNNSQGFEQRYFVFTTGNSKIPGTLPYNGESIVNRNINYKTKLEVNGREEQANNVTRKFVESTIPSFEFDAGKVGHKSDNFLMRTQVSGDSSTRKIENVKLDYSQTDKKLLSLVGSVRLSKAIGIGITKGKLNYVTNKGEKRVMEITVSVGTKNYPLNLAIDEYVEELWIVFENESDLFPNERRDIKIMMDPRVDYPRTYPLDGSFRQGTVDKKELLNANMKLTAKGIEEKNFEKEIVVSGEQDFIIDKPSEDVKIDIIPEVNASYQSEKFEVTVNNLLFTINKKINILDGDYHKGDNNYIRIVNPTIYFVLDKSYSINTSDIDLQGNDANVKFENGILNDGDSLLTIEFKNYEKLFRSGDNSGYSLSIMNDLKLPIFTKPNSKEGDKTIIKNIYYDLDKSAQTYKNYIADVKIDDSSKIIPNNGILNNTKKLYAIGVNENKNKVLSSTEMGTSSTGQNGNGTIDLDITGYDNDTYKQEISVISNANQDTYDWKLYIPVPKKGKTVKYTDANNVVESAAADYSFYLSRKVELANQPIGTKIEYTTDTEPKYSLTGNDGGAYTENIASSDLKNVTMIRITIPKVGAKEKLFPLITYKVDGNKTEVGKQTAYGANYYNAKVGSSSANYYFNGGSGGHAPLVSFNLMDFEINGMIWEDTEEPINHLFDDTDLKKGNIQVVAKAQNNKDYTAITDKDGKYRLKVPSSGDTTVSVTLPNEKGQTYSFVDASNKENGSKFSSSGQAEIILDDADVYGINAGLMANRSVHVNPKDVMVAKGGTVNVPVVVFPSYAKVTYNQSVDSDIAVVSNTGIISGKKVGSTKATVAIPDGKGGKTTAEYNIKVVPAGVPSATSKPYYMFQGGSFDPHDGITILDSDKNNINVEDKSKVSIDSNLNTNEIGKYCIRYTINDGYHTITHTRSVFVYGTPVLTLPKNKVLKVNTTYNALDGVDGYYTRVAEDGTLKPKTRVDSITTTNGSTITPLVPSSIDVNVSAHVTLPDNSGELTDHGSYIIAVHDHAQITTAVDELIVKVGMPLDEIIGKFGGKGFMMTKDNEIILPIDWSEFNDFDTSKAGASKTADISVIDPDTNAIVTKSVTIKISQGVTIEAPKEVDTIVGKPYNPATDVKITDGDGNDIPVEGAIISKNEVNISTPGNYEVEYEYEDKHGNKNTASTIVRVHGKLVFNTDDIHQIQGDATDDLNNIDVLSKLASFINSDNEMKYANLISSNSVDSNVVGKSTQTIQFKHPYGTNENMERNIYTYGKVEIIKPKDMVVKVNTEIEILKDVSAAYQHVNTNGDIFEKKVDVTSDLGTKITSAVVDTKEIPLKASVKVIDKLVNKASASYNIAFNGLPSITTKSSEITVRVGASDEEIKNLLDAYASVQYVKENKPQDLTDKIIWVDLDKVDTSKEKGSYVIILKVTDADGAEVNKSITVNVSNNIIMNLPDVNKVVGDTFDPFEGVDIFDGNGNKVNPKDVQVDDTNVNMSKPGSYDVEYSYKDSYGNEKKQIHTIRVNGQLEFNKMDRIDLIEKDGMTYVPTQGKAYYIDYNGKRVYVDGMYDKNVNQGTVRKHTVFFSATHPIDGSKGQREQYVYVHGDIVFKDLDKGKTLKVHDMVYLSERVSASYIHVNDDGSYKIVDVNIVDKIITSDKVGKVHVKVNAEIEIFKGLVNRKSTEIDVPFNGFGHIEANSFISFVGSPTKDQVLNAINATAGMKDAQGYEYDLTSSVEFLGLDKLELGKSGVYSLRLTVVDPDGFKTYKDVIITIEIPKAPESIKPVQPNPDNQENGSDVGKKDNQIKKETNVTVIVKDIPLENLKDGIHDDVIKSYIRVLSNLNENEDFTIVNSTIKNKVGNYKVKIRLSDGSEQTVNIHVIDTSKRDVQQPEFGREDECFIHWIMLLLLLGYSIYSVTVILKQHNRHGKMQNAIKEYEEQRNGGKYED